MQKQDFRRLSAEIMYAKHTPLLSSQILTCMLLDIIIIITQRFKWYVTAVFNSNLPQELP